MKNRLKMAAAIISLAVTLVSCGGNSSNSGPAGTNSSGATLVSVAVTPTNPSIAKGTTQQFTATGSYSNNTTQNITSTVSWSASDTTKATVSSTGLATAVDVGSTTISASSGNISGSSTLTISAAPLVSIAVTPANPSIAKGTTKQFTATGTFADNTTQDLTTQVVWTSADTTKATITSGGSATGTGVGSATITATIGGVSGTVTLTVTNATLVSISVTPTNPSIAKGTIKQCTAMGTFTDNATQDLTTQVVWTSTDTTKATITNTGLATGTGVGTTTITATLGSSIGTTTLTVTAAALVSIAVTPNNPNIALGTSQQFIAIGAYSDNTNQSLTSLVTWSSSSTSVATISNAGGSNGKVTSLATGSTTISAVEPVSGISGSTTLIVTTYLMGGAIQGRPLNLSNSVSTIAGLARIGSSDGIGTTARFNFPKGVITDGTNLYVADTNNHIIRKIVIATGAVSTIAGISGYYGSADGTGASARFCSPYGITSDGTSLYVADAGNGTIRKIVIATASVSTVAGAAGYFGSSDGIGSSARFSFPEGLTTDGTNLYVSDTQNCTIRKISITTGTVTTLAGSAGLCGSTDGIGSAARFGNSSSLATDGTNLYVTDSSNSVIRKIVIASGVVTTLAGSGFPGNTDGIATAAQFGFPQGIIIAGSDLYVTDGSYGTVRKIVIATGAVTTVAGSGTNGSADGTGASATFNGPWGITTDGANLYVADSDNSSIRKVTINTTEVTTIAGSTGSFGSQDGVSSAARFNFPAGMTTDGSSIYVADTGNNTIRKLVSATGAVTTIAGTAGLSGATDGTGLAASFNLSAEAGITTEGTNLFVADTKNHTIRKIVIATGTVTTIAGSAGLSGSNDGIGAAARFNRPGGITTDGTNLYITDTNNNSIRKIVIDTGAVTTIAGVAGSAGSVDGTDTIARFNFPYGITTDGSSLYVTDAGNGSTIRKISLATNNVSTLAGSSSTRGSSDGTGSSARFTDPLGITTDGTNLYITDTFNFTIRKLEISTGKVTTIVGSAGLSGSIDGTGAAARFYKPCGITLDGTYLFVVDTENNTIRKIQ